LPILFQKQVDDFTSAAVWKIEEEEDFFLQKIPLLQEVHHPHKRLQHLAGRYLLFLLTNDFPFRDIKINAARKPYLPSQQYLFSISHCGHYAAVIISSKCDCGIDIELISPKTEKVKTKFLGEDELQLVQSIQSSHSVDFRQNELYTICWCVKEAVYKWWGDGKVDFKGHIHIQNIFPEQKEMSVLFQNELTRTELFLHLLKFENLIMTWTIASKKD
jgi:phosphopantetheinyl transferase